MAKVRCEHCGLLFGESSIDRHIELLHDGPKSCNEEHPCDECMGALDGDNVVLDRGAEA